MGPAIPKTLDDIYNDYTIRREALLTALTDGEGPCGCFARCQHLGF